MLQEGGATLAAYSAVVGLKPISLLMAPFQIGRGMASSLLGGPRIDCAPGRNLILTTVFIGCEPMRPSIGSGAPHHRGLLTMPHSSDIRLAFLIAGVTDDPVGERTRGTRSIIRGTAASAFPLRSHTRGRC
jgi:hypothetical protein